MLREMAVNIRRLMLLGRRRFKGKEIYCKGFPDKESIISIDGAYLELVTKILGTVLSLIVAPGARTYF